jgi:cell division protein FtsL
MSTRFGQIASAPFLDRRSGNLRWVVIAGLVVLFLMLYVGGKVQIMRIGYQINELEKQKQELEQANRALQIEASSLSSPSRIEEIAVRRLGMVRPAKENIVVVKRRPEEPTSAEGHAGAGGAAPGRRAR